MAYLNELFNEIGLVGEHADIVAQKLLSMKPSLHEGPDVAPIPISVFVQLEQMRQSKSQTTQIYHKLLFDTVNEEILKLRPNGGRPDPPAWIRRSIRSRLATYIFGTLFCQISSRKTTCKGDKWDKLESRPQDARVYAAHYSTEAQ